jgi:hypothetical protein
MDIRVAVLCLTLIDSALDNSEKKRIVDKIVKLDTIQNVFDDHERVIIYKELLVNTQDYLKRCVHITDSKQQKSNNYCCIQ